MAYRYYNPNPKHKNTSDCVVRALTKIFDIGWMEAYDYLSEIVSYEYEMPSSNSIWERFLLMNGFKKKLLPSDCPDCTTVKEFAGMFNKGQYVACTGTHVVAIIDGVYYDAWDSGEEIVSYYFKRR